MAAADIFFKDNDMIATLSNLRSSTAPTVPIVDSTGVTVTVWSTLSTGNVANRLINARNMRYSSADGVYRATIQSTDTNMAARTLGLAIVRLDHSGMNGEWNVRFRVEDRSES